MSKFRSIAGMARRRLVHLVDIKSNALAKKICESGKKYGEYKRVYNIHIRKTGGTTINSLFLSRGQLGYKTTYDIISDGLSNRVIDADERAVFVGWNPLLINEGYFTYGFSHIPLHSLKLRNETYTLTCFRDPLARVVSLYQMLEFQLENIPAHPGLRTQRNWLGKGFKGFIDCIPRSELYAQIYMFSRRYDIGEAIDAISKVNCVMKTEDLSSGIGIINKDLGLDLKCDHVRKGERVRDIGAYDLEYAREKLSIEYKLLSGIDKYICGTNCE